MRYCSFALVIAFTFFAAHDLHGADLVGQKVTVEAGPHDRVNAPVRIHLKLDEASRPQGFLELQSPDGTWIPAQIAPAALEDIPPTAATTPAKGSKDYDLIFVVPKLKANEKATYEIISEDEAFDSPRYKWHDTPGKSTELRLGKTPILRYMYEPLDDSTKDRRMETFKVFHHVFSPDGKELLTHWDIKQIFPHHRGLFYGFRAVTYDGNQHVDIWHCLKDTHQKQEKFEAIEAGTVLGRHRLEIAWNGNGKKTFATEHREVTAYNKPGGTMNDLVSRLVPTQGTVKLDGDPP
ncbi:MAG: PmoA family protein, partial [Planctomycetia bacterium]|nr:PmoA family protein [Planctomycetia bacterium]